MADARAHDYDAAVFAGGGTRCFWQMGFWSVAAPALDICPRQAAAVSAGGAAATAALLGKTGEALTHFKQATAANPQNVYPERLLPFSGERAFPHEAMYRAAICNIVDEADVRLLHEGPELRVVVARPPRWLGPRLALLAGLGCYVVEKRRRDPLHGTLSRRVGFTAEVISSRDCPSPEAVADIILASSCTPPFTSLIRRGGTPVLDGSLVDSAPIFALRGQPRRVLVLLTRRYGELPPGGGGGPEVTYVQPSQPISISKWDYTSPDGLQRTFDLGRRDGEAFVTRAGRAVRDQGL